MSISRAVSALKLLFAKARVDADCFLWLVMTIHEFSTLLLLFETGVSGQELWLPLKYGFYLGVAFICLHFSISRDRHCMLSCGKGNPN